MSLYGKDDSNANKTKAGIGVAASSNTKTIVFIDDTEAQLAENKARGVASPGWHSFYTCLLYTSPSPRDLSTSRMPSSA